MWFENFGSLMLPSGIKQLKIFKLIGIENIIRDVKVWESIMLSELKFQVFNTPTFGPGSINR